ncbi:MAG: hypothetical protein LBR53_07635 [Deltaproteobacteria bacterium]|jgi:hypothetical protein|nr:hypothetical protein [Deltaproteobacteria bacterium]
MVVKGTITELDIGNQQDVLPPGLSSGALLIPGHAYDLSSESEFNNVLTTFTVKYNGTIVTSPQYYTFVNKAITLLDRGEYQIEMIDTEIRNRGTVYGTAVATVETGILDVLPAGSAIVWKGGTSSYKKSWTQSIIPDVVANWLIEDFRIRYLDDDIVIFGSEGGKEVIADSSGVKPSAMNITAGGYTFTGGKIEGQNLNMNASGADPVVIENEIFFPTEFGWRAESLCFSIPITSLKMCL